jgi:hypothetical protein
MKVIVNNQQNKTVSVNTQGTTEVVAVGIQGPAGPSSITYSADVDSTTLVDGSVLVYKTTTQKWVSTTLLDRQNMEGGFF